MNLLGIWLGHKTVKWLELREFNFSGVAQMQQPKGTIYRVLGQFTPKTWTRYHWGMFTHWKRFIYVTIIIIYFQLLDINSFFLKAELWLKPSHYLNLVRLVILAFLASLSLRQVYQYIIDKKTKDIGGATWLIGIILLLESALCFKWGYPMYKDVPWPEPVKWGWAISVSVVVGVAVLFFGFRQFHYWSVSGRTRKPKSH